MCYVYKRYAGHCPSPVNSVNCLSSNSTLFTTGRWRRATAAAMKAPNRLSIGGEGCGACDNTACTRQRVPFVCHTRPVCVRASYKKKPICRSLKYVGRRTPLNPDRTVPDRRRFSPGFRRDFSGGDSRYRVRAAVVHGLNRSSFWPRSTVSENDSCFDGAPHRRRIQTGASNPNIRIIRISKSGF